MSNPSQSQGGGVASMVLLIVGGVLMLLAIILAIYLYVWGHSGPTYGENWNDLIAAGLTVYIGGPVFLIGLVLLIIGLVLRFKK